MFTHPLFSLRNCTRLRRCQCDEHRHGTKHKTQTNPGLRVSSLCRGIVAAALW